MLQCFVPVPEVFIQRRYKQMKIGIITAGSFNSHDANLKSFINSMAPF